MNERNSKIKDIIKDFELLSHILGPVSSKNTQIFVCKKYSCPRDLRIGGVGGDMKKSFVRNCKSWTRSHGPTIPI